MYIRLLQYITIQNYILKKNTRSPTASSMPPQPRGGASSRLQQNPAAVIMSHGRSGAMLLLEFLRQDPEMWTFFEPLQSIRQMPPHLLKVHAGRCRDNAFPDAAMSPACPLRDSTVLLALASCETESLQTTWYQENDLTAGTEQWIPHPNPHLPGLEYRSTREHPNLASLFSKDLIRQRRACLERPRRAIKTIRLNGYLETLLNVTIDGRFNPPLVIQVLREPTAVFASRKQFKEPRLFGMPRMSGSRRKDEASIRRWAKYLCAASIRDTNAGKARGRLFERVWFYELLSKPREVLSNVYRHYGRRPPVQVLDYVDRWLERNLKMPAVENTTWQYLFGTSPRNAKYVINRWKRALAQWEIDAVTAGCAKGKKWARTGWTTRAPLFSADEIGVHTMASVGAAWRPKRPK